ncbi:CAP domain-containing protein [Streptomyces sp. NPDC052236]|uniref:CAP domain-containing protein n=1 Tax=Streptomyces sp. NPDC052236 TaxID=3365686 RepID=UPI0037D148FB
MRKHRRQKHHRKIIIAAFAIGAVGVPSAALACVDQPENTGSQFHDVGENAAFSHPWTGARTGAKPSAGASQTPTAAPSAPETAAPSAPAAPAASAPAPSSTPAVSGASARIAELVNSERAKAGCAPLAVNAKLTKAAQDHSKDMADHQNMSHTGSGGSSPGDRITGAGYSWSTYGENVAAGYATPESVMAGWMSSPGHKDNILNCAFKEIGVGLAQPGNYWTQDFGAAR